VKRKILSLPLLGFETRSSSPQPCRYHLSSGKIMCLECNVNAHPKRFLRLDKTRRFRVKQSGLYG